ncbi:MAG: hypothetical protein ABIH42_09535 [Planctomycetota bacterium]
MEKSKFIKRKSAVVKIKEIPTVKITKRNMKELIKGGMALIKYKSQTLNLVCDGKS